MRRLAIFGFALGIAAAAWAQKPAPWGHAPSPYRAVFKITAQPNHRKAGYYLNVPVCGLGNVEGADVFICDAQARPLPALALGRTTNNCALVLAGGELPNGSTIYAYFGSGNHAPQAAGMIPGLTVDIRTGDQSAELKDWREARRVLTKSERIGIVPISKIELAANPIDSTDVIIMDFQGQIQLAETETWEVFMATDDAGYLFVENRSSPVLERNGRHWANDDVQGRNRVKVKFDKGLNPVRCLVFDLGGNEMGVLARYVDERRKSPVPAEAFVHSGSSQLQGIETENQKKECPAFSVQLLNYIGIDDQYYTAYRLSTYGNVEVTWTIGNGMRGKSAVFNQLVVGTASLSVEAVAKDGAKAVGLIQMGAIPERISWRHWPTYRAYSDLINAQGAENLSPAYCRAFLAFFNLYERNADAARLCEALLAQTGLKAAERRELLLNLARCAAAREPEKARKAYLELLKDTAREKQHDLYEEYCEFELLRMAAADAGRKAVDQLARTLPKGAPEADRYRALLELLTGKAEVARDLLEKYRAAIVAKSKPADAVRANNLLAAHEEHVRTGYDEKAETALRQWIELAPEALLSGQYALVEARYRRRIGWAEGALNLLDKTLAVNPLAAFLPDMELERGLCLRSLKKPDEAKAVFARIAKEYPNHPAADAAKELLK